MSCIYEQIKNKLKGRVAIVGIGNRLRGDDGFGPSVIEHLKGKLAAYLLDAGTAPENFLGRIIKNRPDTVVLLDTADMGRTAGSIDILDKDDILKVGFSTHDASSRMVIDFLEANIKNLEIFMVAVQPKTVRFGDELSAEVKEAVNRLEKCIGPK